MVPAFAGRLLSSEAASHGRGLGTPAYVEVGQTEGKQYVQGCFCLHLAPRSINCPNAPCPRWRAGRRLNSEAYYYSVLLLRTRYYDQVWCFNPEMGAWQPHRLDGPAWPAPA